MAFENYSDINHYCSCISFCPGISDDPLKELIMKKLLKIIILLAVIAAGLYFERDKIFDLIHPNDPAVTNEIVKQTLEKSSELTAGKLKLTGVLNYDDKGIPVLTNGKFRMQYEAEVRAGIDVSKIKINNVDNDKKIISVSVPKAEILGAEVDPASLDFFDKSFTLFDLHKQEDVAKAQSEAKDDIIKKASESGLLELADKQSQDLITGILSTGFPDYTVQFE